MTSIRRSDLAIGALPLLLGVLSGIPVASAIRTWYRRLDRPSWTPPDAAFGPVWTVLYTLMGASLVLLRRDRTAAREARRRALGIFGIQLALNLAWTPIFFGLRRIRLAGVEILALWVSIAAAVVAAFRVRRLAAILLVPYLAWTTLATALNLEIWRRNR